MGRACRSQDLGEGDLSHVADVYFPASWWPGWAIHLLHRSGSNRPAKPWGPGALPASDLVWSSEHALLCSQQQRIRRWAHLSHTAPVCAATGAACWMEKALLGREFLQLLLAPQKSPSCHLLHCLLWPNMLSALLLPYLNIAFCFHTLWGMCLSFPGMWFTARQGFGVVL